jgi:hypothetical protein
VPCDVNFQNNYVERLGQKYFTFAENGGYQVNYDFDNKKITASKTSEPIELNVVNIQDYNYQDGEYDKFLSDYNFETFNSNNTTFEYDINF